MYHIFSIKNAATKAAFYFKLLAFSVLALLISNTAACLASRLARSLAFAATAVLVAKIASFNSLDMFHSSNLHELFKKIIA